ncbi:MAG: SDR family NAD(P)-dependent oxidoreductase [Myxococcota bacterium]
MAKAQPKRVLVTGASRGIGRAIVKLLALKGMRIVATGRDATALKRVAQLAPDRITVVVGDIAKGDERDALVPQAVQELGGLDGLVNCAGVLRYGDVGAIHEQDLIVTLKVNLMAPLLLAQAAAPHLRETRGAIVNVASTLGIRPAPGLAAYSASKAALLSITRTLAAELAPAVRVNAVAPGVVDTDMPRQLRLAPGQSKPGDVKAAVAQQLEVLRSLHPLGRLGEPKEVAEAVHYCLGAEWLTGAVLPVDGGLLAV